MVQRWPVDIPAANLVKVAEVIITGAAVTNIDISGLDLAADKCYMMLLVIKNPLGSSTSYSLFYNGDYTATNYYNQRLYGSETTAGASLGNNAFVADCNPGTSLFCHALIMRDPDGYPRALGTNNRHAPSAVFLEQRAHIRNNTANVTSLRIACAAAGGIGVNSKLTLYKLI